MEENYWLSLRQGFFDYLKNEVSNVNKVLCHHRHAFNRLEEFVRANGHDTYTPDVGMKFYEAEVAKQYVSATTLGYRRACVKRLNSYLFGMTYWQRKPRALQKYCVHNPKTPLTCPEQFSEKFDEFMQYVSGLGLKAITIDQYRDSCLAFLNDFDRQGVQSWDDLTADHLTEAFKHTTNKYHFITYSKRLLQYLTDRGVIETNYALVLPRMAKKKCYPSVYTEQEINALLDSVERYTPQGKRDYAVILMAVRTGLRQSDIRDLKFENIDFQHHMINLIQFKTGLPLSLSIPKDVEDALNNYLQNGREESESQFVFTNGYGNSLSRNAVSHTIARHFEKAKIVIGNRHHGAHALRMTFASQLVEEKVPYDVVRALLGHSDPQATKHYVQFAMEDLRDRALEVPPAKSIFAAYLKEGEHGN